MHEFRLRTVAARATAPTQWWPRWAPLIVWIIACAVLSAALVHLSPLIYGWDTRDELVQLFRLAPTLAVAVLFVVFRDPHQRPVLVLARKPSWRLVLATGLAVLTGAVVVVTTLAARDTFLGHRTALPVLGVPLMVTVAAAVVTALCEEVAWRSWLQPQLEEWWGPLLAAVAVGFTWGLWYTLIRRPDLDHALSFGLMTMALSVAIRALLYLAPGQNLIVATAAHAAINVGILTMLPGRGEDPSTAWSLVVASWVVAIALWLASRFRPGRPAAAPMAGTDIDALDDADIGALDDADIGALDDADIGEAEWVGDLADDLPTADHTDPSAVEPTGEFTDDRVVAPTEVHDPWHWIDPDRAAPDAAGEQPEDRG